MLTLNKKQIKEKQKVLHKIVEKKLVIDKKIDYVDNIKIFDITKKFIIKNNLVIYGGSAINSILKKSDKFYGDDEIPDYDFYSDDAQRDAKNLCDLYAKNGYMYIEAKEGIHTGTYKVYVDFIPVADITSITPRLMETMRNNSVLNSDKIKCASPDILRISMYLELSRPDGNIERWNKVFERLSLLNINYPIKTKNSECQKESVTPLLLDTTPEMKIKRDILKSTLTFIKSDNELIMFGTTANTIYQKVDKKKDLHTSTLFYENPILVTYFDIISIDIDKTLEKLINELEKMNKKTLISETPQEESEPIVKISFQQHSGLGIGEIIPEHYIVTVNGFNLIALYKSEACYSYIRYKNMNIATIDTMLSFYLAFLIANRKYYMREKIICMCHYLLELHIRKYKSKTQLFKRFVLDCIGHQDTLPDILRKKWITTDKGKKKWIYRP